MNALAVIEEPMHADHISAMRQAQQYVRTAPAVDAADLMERARIAREWVKVMRGAREMAVEAIRLGELGESRMAGSRARAAVLFGAMTPEEFDSEVLADIRTHGSALGVANRIIKQREQDANWRLGADLANGKGARPADAHYSIHALTQAASALLDEFSNGAGPVSLEEMAEALADEMDHSHGWTHDAAIREGYREVVRQAIRNETKPERSSIGGPWFVTYEDDDAGWLRIPWYKASLDQFRAMVEFRQAQAVELAAAADRLAEVLAVLDDAKAALPRSSRIPSTCSALEKVVRDGHRSSKEVTS